MLYANSPVPLYRQLYRYYRKAIDEGDLPVGEKLPSERQIAAEYGISRITARKALEILRQEGYVCAFQGKGAFVTHSTPQLTYRAPVRSFSEAVLAMGMRPSSKMLTCDIVPVDGKIAQQLEVTDDDRAIKIQRLRLANGVPIVLDTAYLSYPLCEPILQANLEKSSLHRTLQETLGITLDHANESLQWVLMHDGDVQLLRLVPPTTVIQLKRQTYDAGGQLVEYVESIYRGDGDAPKIYAAFDG
jgi:GntR family transcriptional regulator